jgi:hypothetical protein
MIPSGLDLNTIIWARLQLKLALANLDAAIDGKDFGRVFAVEYVRDAVKIMEEATTYLARRVPEKP